MERNSTNENLEHFLRQNAEDFRMHPSEKVWNQISKNLHRGKRRFYIGFLALLISSSIVGYIALNVSTADRTTLKSVDAPGNINSGAGDQKAEAILENSSTSARPQVSNASSEKEFASTVTGSTNHEVAVTPGTELESATKTDNTTTDNILEQQRISWPANAFSVFRSAGLLSNLKTTSVQPLDLSNLSKEEADVAQVPKKPKKNNRFSTMFFFAPTISYRKLSENKSYLRSSPVGAPYSYAALYDVNSVVTHKPDIGLEFGVTSKYDLTKNIKVRAGLQFNVNRYDIKAFKYTPEVATIALNNRHRVDSLNTLSNYRNFNGGKTDWLQNLYFQLSAPIGLEVKIKGDEKMYFGAASTIQPTYVIGDRAYLITADYKNYANVPWLIRRWNVNTNLETFVAYSTRKVKWQVGPQVRYQLLSSFASKYPVKENLFDFGLKVGVSLNQKQ